MVVIDGAVEIEAGDDSMRAETGTLLEFEPTERRTVRSPDGARLLMVFAPWPGPGHYPSD